MKSVSIEASTGICIETRGDGKGVARHYCWALRSVYVTASILLPTPSCLAPSPPYNHRGLTAEAIMLFPRCQPPSHQHHYHSATITTFTTTTIINILEANVPPMCSFTTSFCSHSQHPFSTLFSHKNFLPLYFFIAFISFYFHRNIMNYL